jgi:hypothetical protein
MEQDREARDEGREKPDSRKSTRMLFHADADAEFFPLGSDVNPRGAIYRDPFMLTVS